MSQTYTCRTSMESFLNVHYDEYDDQEIQNLRKLLPRVMIKVSHEEKGLGQFPGSEPTKVYLDYLSYIPTKDKSVLNQLLMIGKALQEDMYNPNVKNKIDEKL